MFKATGPVGSVAAACVADGAGWAPAHAEITNASVVTITTGLILIALSPYVVPFTVALNLAETHLPSVSLLS